MIGPSGSGTRHSIAALNQGMRRVLGLIVVLALVGVACGGSPSAPTAAGDATTAGAAATTTSAPGTMPPSTSGGSGTAAPAEVPDPTAAGRIRPEGPDAPDIALALGEGGIFVLSEEEKPVYLVFWAEW